MRRLLILTGREIRDQVGFFIATATIALVVAFAMTSVVLTDHKEVVPLLSAAGLLPGAALFAVFLCSFGDNQMQADRTKNLSAFLTALPVTRGHIFVARVLAGILWILTFLVPLVVAGAILIELRDPASVPIELRGLPSVPTYRGLLADAFAGVFLTCLACYCVGLYAGCGTRAGLWRLGGLPFVMLLPVLVVIKGFSVELVVILSLFIAACLTSTWYRFSRSSL